MYSDNGTTYFYNPDEQLASQLTTGGVSAGIVWIPGHMSTPAPQVSGGSILLPNWSAYSGTPSQIVAMKVGWLTIADIHQVRHGWPSYL